MWFGFALVLVGVLLLLNNLGIIQGNTWDYIWPAVVILIGLSILLRRKDPNCCPPKVKAEEKKDGKDDKKDA